MEKIRGVNLGGWFVLERWMSQALFEGVVGKDETVFSQQKPSAEAFLHQHWETFITEDDFIWLAKHKINLVRIPFPWWVFGEDKPYFSCLKWLDRAMNWAAKHELAVLLDLHTAPGCQNGFDNGGIEGVCTWHEKTDNIEKTIEVLEKVAHRYKDHPALWGIEALNEPRWDIDMTIIQQFYLDTYTRLRSILSPSHTIVFHDSFRNDQWVEFFENNKLENVVLDLHLYQCFGDSFNEAGIVHNLMFPLKEQIEVIDRVSKTVRCIVGEWSLGLHPHNFDNLDRFNRHLALRSFAANQLFAFERGFGWVFWNYKIASDSYNWNFRKLVDTEVLPSDYSL
ncbi:MAG: cellulase family glycosylhydrolase [Erysipelothrix sp.]|nr:cellulase family glycosylhydrolase [Erysipelothrix sp.]